ncbi:MAG: hypothetical protein ABI867_40290, partial [Kofleriaceae bacterium]
MAHVSDHMRMLLGLIAACTRLDDDRTVAIAPPPPPPPPPPPIDAGIDAAPPPIDPRSGPIRIYAWDGTQVRSLYCSPLPAAGAKRTLSARCDWPAELTVTLAGKPVVAKARTVTLESMGSTWRGSVYRFTGIGEAKPLVIVETARGTSVWSAGVA